MLNENLSNLVDVAEVPEDVAFQRVKEKFDSSGHDFSKSVRAGIQEEINHPQPVEVGACESLG